MLLTQMNYIQLSRKAEGGSAEFNKASQYFSAVWHFCMNASGVREIQCCSTIAETDPFMLKALITLNTYSVDKEFLNQCVTLVFLFISYLHLHILLCTATLSVLPF